MSIFDEQVSRKPNLYSWTDDFIKSMHDGFWTDKEFSFSSDKQDFKVSLSEEERDIIIKTLSAIAQIEVAVKTFWGKLGDNLPHPSLVDLGYVLANTECYSSDTEILTPNGWRFIKDIRVGDKVYQVNTDSCIEETSVKNTICKKYVGKMYEFGSNSNNCLVTPNHEMVIQRKKTTGWAVEKVKAKDVKFHSAIKIPKTVIYKNGPINHLSDYEKILIAVQADGTRSYGYKKDGSKFLKGNSGGLTHQLRFKKERKIQRFKEIIKNTDIEYTESILADEETVLFTIRLPIDNDFKDFSWVDLSNKTSNWCKEFVNELFHWDGSLQWRAYYSKHKLNVDFCQHVGILAGLNTTVGFTEDKRNKNSTKYRVLFSRQPKLWRHITDMSNKIIDYDDNVYCVEVDSGIILTRRSGKTFIAGNCVHNRAYERLLQELNMEDIFEENLKLECIQNRVKYLKKYTHKFYKDSRKQYLYAIILFTLFVENVSLFSQFYIIAWFGRYKNVLKDTNQQIAYTRNEELVHANVGTKIINTIREELPELFDQDLEDKILNEAEEAFKAESKIIDWIIGDWSNKRISKEVLQEYIKERINQSLKGIGFKTIFTINQDLKRDFEWADEELLANNAADFFHSRPVNYSKNIIINEEELI